MVDPVNKMPSLALGTVQFGMPYGIANRAGKIENAEAGAIIRMARSHGVHDIDTAVAYGDSEEILGRLSITDFQTVSKLPPIPDDCPEPGDWVHQLVNGSLARLGLPQLRGLLMHRSDDLLKIHGPQILKAVEELKREKKIEKFGISTYDPADAMRYLDVLGIDIVQCPFNVFDRRLVNGQCLEKLTARKVEVQVRSAFLQGLLLMGRDEIPQKFSPWSVLFSEWHTWLKEQGISAVSACLQFIRQFRQISLVIVGIDSTDQLQGILNAWNQPGRDVPEKIQSNAPQLINPSLWSQL